jgi:hypothetical protein
MTRIAYVTNGMHTRIAYVTNGMHTYHLFIVNNYLNNIKNATLVIRWQKMPHQQPHGFFFFFSFFSPSSLSSQISFFTDLNLIKPDLRSHHRFLWFFLGHVTTSSLRSLSKLIFGENTLYPSVVWPIYRLPIRGLKFDTLLTCCSSHILSITQISLQLKTKTKHSFLLLSLAISSLFIIIIFIRPCQEWSYVSLSISQRHRLPHQIWPLGFQGLLPYTG